MLSPRPVVGQLGLRIDSLRHLYPQVAETHISRVPARANACKAILSLFAAFGHICPWVALVHGGLFNNSNKIAAENMIEYRPARFPEQPQEVLN